MATRRGDPRSQRKYKLVRLQVLARDNNTCFYCNAEADTVDHIVPVSKSDDKSEAYNPNNLVACCKRCNSSRGNKSQALFLARTATPPVFSVCTSPMQSEPMLDSPFKTRPSPSQ
jgi:5-methylcytosine-specific restriction endonuclease McrA